MRRHPSDLTDVEWEIVEPMLPSPQWMGRPEKHPRRAIIDGILYVVRTGCAWRYLPVDFPPWQTVYAHLTRLNSRGATERILTELREQVRLAHGRQAEPTAGIIDSQSVKGADTVPRVPAATTPVKRSTAGSGSSSPTPSDCGSGGCPGWTTWRRQVGLFIDNVLAPTLV